MIDTIKLTLDKNMFWITKKEAFQKETMNASRGYFKLVQNPLKGELKAGIYSPRLSLTKRFNCSGRFEPTLTIELSLPKLLFTNNFDELVETDFQQILEKLRKRLKEMSVGVFTEVLENAPVSAAHYSKNIPLTDGTTPHYLIGKIKEANIKLSLDVNQTDYQNNGYSYKWHANSYEVAFYDKIKELNIAKVSEKRSIEKDNAIQLKLFDTYKPKSIFEVLRMEVRLNNRQKIKQLFKTLKIENEVTFKNVFNKSISQRVLLHYLSELENKRMPLLDYNTKSPKELLSTIIINNPKLGLKKTIQLYGLKKIFEEVNTRELRSMFGNCSQRSWYRLIAETKNIKLPKGANPLNIIRTNIEKFEPLKLVDYM